MADQEPTEYEKLKKAEATGLVTGAAMMGFAWIGFANWDVLSGVYTSAWFYKLLAITSAWAVISAWWRHRKARKALMGHLRDVGRCNLSRRLD
jgi:hypothetical protein